MSGGTFVTVLIVVFLAVTIAKMVYIVPQGEEWVVESLGKYSRTLLPGLGWIIPYVDRVAYKLVTKDIILDVQEQEVITRDNAVILVNAIAFIKVTDPVKAVYGVENYSEAIRNMIMTTLRSITGEMELDEALSSRDKIKLRLRESIADEAVDWGLTVKSVEIQDIKPSPSMQKAMELQAAAERERKATVTKAEGEKQAAILRPRRARNPPSRTPKRRSCWPRPPPRPSAGWRKPYRTKTRRSCTCWARNISPPSIAWASRTTPNWWCCRAICTKA